MITVPALTLLDRDDDPATLDGYGPIDPDTARQLTATAPTFIRILTHPETGAVLSIGRNRYTVPADLRTYLQIWDQTCRYPGCNKPVRRCDIDHSRDWVNGGTTSHDNLTHLCRADHQLKHHTTWQYEHTNDDGTLHWTSPTGHTYTTTINTPRFE